MEVGRVAESLGQLEGDGCITFFIGLELPESQPFQSSALDFGCLHRETMILGEVGELEVYDILIELGSDWSRRGGCAGGRRCCRGARDAQLLPHVEGVGLFQVVGGSQLGDGEFIGLCDAAEGVSRLNDVILGARDQSGAARAAAGAEPARSASTRSRLIVVGPSLRRGEIK